VSTGAAAEGPPPSRTIEEPDVRPAFFSLLLIAQPLFAIDFSDPKAVQHDLKKGRLQLSGLKA